MLARGIADAIRQRLEAIAEGAEAIAGGGPELAAVAKRKAWAAKANADGYTTIGPDGGPNDALRHCTWAALVMMAALVPFSLFAPTAWVSVSRASRSPAVFLPTARRRTRSVLLAHELAGTGLRTIGSRMDQHNNEIGMDLAANLFRSLNGADLAEELYEVLYPLGPLRSNSKIRKRSREALDNGDLRMIVGNRLVSTRGWRDRDPTTWGARATRTYY
jgi:hypothetical protein